MGDDYTVISMVEKGLGVSILSELILSGCARDIVRMDLEPQLKRRVGIGVKSKKCVSPAVIPALQLHKTFCIFSLAIFALICYNTSASTEA